MGGIVLIIFILFSGDLFVGKETIKSSKEVSYGDRNA